MKLELRRVVIATPSARDARRHWAERHTLLVRLSDRAGQSGVGEASPLPGYSPDQLSEVEVALQALSAERLLQALDQGDARQALMAVAEQVPEALPSARMALETAALDLLGQQRGLSTPALLGASPQATRPLSALIGAAHEPALADAAETALSQGYGVVKVKLGAPRDFSTELSGLQALAARIGKRARLRLDAGAQLTAVQVGAVWDALSGLELELFEEPGEVPERLNDVLPLALDESLQRLGSNAIEQLARARRARYLVLKPMTLGGISRCLELAELAHALGLRAVLSHSFDGPWAFRATAAAALALPEDVAHGLAPHDGLLGYTAVTDCVRAGRLVGWASPGLGLEGAAP